MKKQLNRFFYVYNEVVKASFIKIKNEMEKEAMKKVSLKSTILLVLTALVWGMAFVAQSVGMNYIGPFTFNCMRSIMGGIVLIPCIMFFDKKKRQMRVKENQKTFTHC